MNASTTHRTSSGATCFNVALGLALVLFHLVVNRQYGFHGDELYFIVCGWRPAWGYVDHPVLVPMLARVATDLFGLNLFAVRLFPALALGAGCFLTGWLARRLGAGSLGVGLAALAFVCAPMLLRLGAILNIPAFEVVFWLIAAHLVVTLCQRDDARWWVLIGVLMGVSLHNKHTTLFLGTGLAVGMLLTPRRKDLRTPWPWLGGGIALLLFLPNLWWQYRHDWATYDFVRNLNAGVMQDASRVEFVLSQFILMNIASAVLWVGGLLFLLHSAAGRPYRILGWVFVVILTILLFFNAKVYYLIPAFPMLLAAGAAGLDPVGASSGRRRYTLTALGGAIVAVGLLFLPMFTPVGTLEWKERYIGRVLGFMLDDPSDLTFDFRYQLGREEHLDALAKTFDQLSPAAQANCVILTNDYGIASSVNVLGDEGGLPQAIGGSNSYYLWGPQGASGSTVIALAVAQPLLRECFGKVEFVETTIFPWLKGDHQSQGVYVCTDPRDSLNALWPKLKTYR